MTARARVDYVLHRDSVRIGISPRVGQILAFGSPEVRLIEDRGAAPAEDELLYLPEDSARALYEALTDYFGHSGHDTRALRRDYEAERARVDLFIAQAVAR